MDSNEANRKPSEIAEAIQPLSYQKAVAALMEAAQSDPLAASEASRLIGSDAWREKMLGCKYPTFLQFTLMLASLDLGWLRETVLQLPSDFLCNPQNLKDVYNFNRLLLLANKLELDDLAGQLVQMAKDDSYNYMRVADIRTLSGFLYLLSQHTPIDGLLKKHGSSFYKKIEFYAPKTKKDRKRNPIPDFIKTVGAADPGFAEKLLLHVRYLLNVKKVAWRGDQPPQEVEAYCNYNLASVLESNGDLGAARAHFGNAAALFKSVDGGAPSGLCVSYAGLARCAAKDGNDLTEAKLLALQALNYAKLANMPEMEGQIMRFAESLKN